MVTLKVGCKREGLCGRVLKLSTTGGADAMVVAVVVVHVMVDDSVCTLGEIG